MSYDIDMIVDHGDGYKTVVFEANTTWNLRPMMEAAGLIGGPTILYGQTGAEAAELLGDVWRELYRNPEVYEKYNSPNGWGLYKNLVPWMKKWYIAARTHPKAVISVW